MSNYCYGSNRRWDNITPSQPCQPNLLAFFDRRTDLPDKMYSMYLSCFPEQLIKRQTGNYALRWELLGVFWWDKELARVLWAVRKALALGESCWSSSYRRKVENGCGEGELACPSGAWMAGEEEDQIQLLWAGAHRVTVDLWPWNRPLTLGNDWEDLRASSKWRRSKTHQHNMVLMVVCLL